MAASGGLLPAVLSMAAVGPNVDALASGLIGWPQALALPHLSCTGLRLDLGLSSSFINAIPVAREVSLSLTEGTRRNSALKWLAKYLPDDSVKDIAGIEISGSSWATLAWGGALRVDVGEEAVAEGVVSGDAVRWLAMLRRGRRSSRVPMTMKPALGLSYPPLEGARSVDAYRLRHRPGVAEDLSG